MTTKFAEEVTHSGRSYYATGKIGTVIATGKRSAEYSDYGDDAESRLWVDIDGAIYPD